MKLFKKILLNFTGDQRGSAMVMVAVAMVALLGFVGLVADIGLIVLNRQQLVNIMDAAALAGAQELPDRPAQAIQVARDYAAINNFDPASLAVSISADNTSITVSGNRNVSMTFSKVLGFNTQTVSANARVTLEGLTSYTGVAPITVSDRDMQGVSFGDLRTLKYGNPSLGSGNFGALSLGGNGANVYRENMINGYSGTLRVGDVVQTKPGNMSGPTGGIDERLARCHDGCTFDHFLPGCPRIIIVPVHRYDPNLQGCDNVTITGFAAFFVDRSISDKDEIMGYFIKTVGEGEAGPSQVNYGLSAARIVN